MNRVARYAFIHGKTHGLMAKAYFSEKLASFVKLTNLLDVSKTLFPHEDINVADKDLIHNLQKQFETLTVDLYRRLLSFFPSPPPLLLHLLREYEYRNLKSIIRGRFTGTKPGPLWDLGKYARLKLSPETFPAALKNTPFAYLIEDLEKKSLLDIEFELDRNYYAELVGCVNNLDRYEKSLIEPCVHEEVRLKNILWALRLRYYFNSSLEDTKERLFPSGYSDIIRHVETFYSLPLDSPDSWKEWKYGPLLILNAAGDLDPGAAEAYSRKLLRTRFRRLFYHPPFTLASVFAFFRLKEYEVGMIKSVTEGVQTGISPSELAAITGVS